MMGEGGGEEGHLHALAAMEEVFQQEENTLLTALAVTRARIAKGQNMMSVIEDRYTAYVSHIRALEEEYARSGRSFVLNEDPGYRQPVDKTINMELPRDEDDAPVGDGVSIDGARPAAPEIRLECPDCHRSNFASHLGFLNHCRIVHNRVFSSLEDAVRSCVAGRAAASGVQEQTGPDEQAETSTHGQEGGASVEEATSRFYVRKRVIIGNTSRFIPLAKREPGDQNTHQWMVYLRGPAEEVDVSFFIKSVRFFLHPSFAPHDVVDVDSPPFQLTRHGWGEFPMRVQLSFVDPNNKPLDLIHHVKLDQRYTGEQVAAEETAVDIEVDRIGHQILQAKYKEKMALLEAQESTPALPVNDSSLREAEAMYPIIASPDSCPENLGYMPASSIEAWRDMTSWKQVSIEWRRAKRLAQYLQERSGVVVPIRAVIRSCRESGLTPEVKAVQLPPELASEDDNVEDVEDAPCGWDDDANEPRVTILERRLLDPAGLDPAASTLIGKLFLAAVRKLAGRCAHLSRESGRAEITTRTVYESMRHCEGLNILLDDETNADDTSEK